MKESAASQTDVKPRLTTWLQRTGKNRIAVFWLGLFAASFLILLLPLLGVPLQDVFGAERLNDPVIFVLWSSGAGLFVFIGLAFTLRCPKCKLNILWYSISKLPNHDNAAYIMLLQKCPGCGYTAAEEDSDVPVPLVPELDSEEMWKKSKPRLLFFITWINAMIMWAILSSSIGNVLLVEPTWEFSFRLIFELLIVAFLFYTAVSVINSKKWALILLYAAFFVNFVVVASMLLEPLISAAWGDQSAMPVGVGFLSAWAIISIGWSLLSVYVMSFKYREYLRWW